MIDNDVRTAIQSAFAGVEPDERLRTRVAALRTRRRRRRLAVSGIALCGLVASSIGLIARDDEGIAPVLTDQGPSTLSAVWPELPLGLTGPVEPTRSGEWRYDPAVVAERFAIEVLELDEPELTPVSESAHSAVTIVRSPSLPRPVTVSLGTPEGGRIWSVTAATTLPQRTLVEITVGPNSFYPESIVTDVAVSPQPAWTTARFWQYRGTTTGETRYESPASSFGIGWGTSSPPEETARATAVWLSLFGPDDTLTDLLVVGVDARDGAARYMVDERGTLVAAPALEDVGADRRLPRAGELDARWREQLVLPYGDEDDTLGDGTFGPELAAPSADGTWWILDTNKSRAVHYAPDGALLDAVPYPQGMGGAQLPFVLGDRLVAFGSGGATALVATTSDAEVVDIGGTHSWTYSDGTRLYADGETLDLSDLDRPRLEPSSWWRAPNGTRFRVEAVDGFLNVTLPDAGKRVRISMVVPAGTAVSAEVAADAAGTIHLLVFADDDGEQLAGYLTVSADGDIGEIEQVRNPLTGKDPGSPAHLRTIPGTTTVALTYVDEDALRIYTRDSELAATSPEQEAERARQRAEARRAAARQAAERRARSGGSTMRLSSALGCTSLEPRSTDPPEGPTPIEAYDCKVVERSFGLFTYASSADAAAAFEDLVRLCAPAVSDDDWIVWANTNEGATMAHDALGGRLSLVRDDC